MFSPTQHDDKLLLCEIGEMMKTLAKHQDREGVPELIQGFYQTYEKLNEKIKTFDYSKNDAIIEKHDIWLKNRVPHVQTPN